MDDGEELPGTVRGKLAAARPQAQVGLARELGLGRVLSAVLGDGEALPSIGRFRVESAAARGGMGALFRAHDPHTGEAVAIKLIDPDASGDAERFFREARILAELRHPAIVRYVDHGHSAAGEPYLAMEWLEGQDLRQRLSREGLAVDEAVQLGLRVSEALAEAHSRGVIHRDLKPGNVFLPGGDLRAAKLLDFGVARPTVQTGPAMTGTGVLVGTPAYMAPEQARGEPDIDARVDLFALGCTLYECLAGRPPFIAEHVLGVLARVLFQDPPPLSELRPDVPAALAELVMAMLSKEPDGRPPSAEAVADALRALGHPDGGAPPKAATLALSSAEQKVVSVLVAAHPAGEHDGALQAAARRHGVRLERVTSGVLVAALSRRGPATDQAADAARLALALRALAPETPIVVATGRGVAGHLLPVGEAIDRGARLLDHRGAGVWLDEVTAALVAGRFEVRTDGGAAHLVGASGDAAPRTLLGKETPFVGRERELAILDAALADSEERAGAVLVTAPAGVGKSRLASEWVRRARAAGPIRLLSARGEPVAAGVPFLLAAQLLRQAAGIDLDGEPAAQRAQLADALAERGVAPGDRARVATFLGELLGIERDDPDAPEELRAARASPLLMGDQVRIAWEDWLAAECERGPVVLVIEDLHWGDAPSVKLIDAALSALRDRPLLVLALARPEVAELFPRLWAERGLQELRLPELSRKASEALARAVLGERADADTLAWIAARAGGHALYLEEVIRAVAEDRRDGVPASVLAMVQARLASLSSEARLVLRAASVFGEVFWGGGVTALAGRPERQVAELLDELIGRETISPQRSSRFPGQSEYRFRHALFREAAGAMLTDDDRTLGHRLAGDWLLAAGERQALVLAEHFERGGDAARAVHWYARGAEEAWLGNDFDGTLALAARARSLGAAGPDLGRILLAECEAHIWRADEGDAAAKAQQAIDHLPAGSARWYDALRYALTAQVPAPMPLLDRITALLETPPEDPDAQRTFVKAAVIASKHLSFRGERERAWAILDRGASVAEDFSPGEVAVAWVWRARGSALLFDGRHDAALPEYLTAARLFKALRDQREECILGVTIGWLQGTELGLHAQAEATLRHSLELARRLNLTKLISSSKQNLGVALMHQGQLESARELLEETVGEFEHAGNARLAGGSRFYLTTLYSQLGDMERAEAHALAALEIAREVPTTRACTLAAYALALVRAGRADDALVRAREAAAILDELGGIEEGESLILLAHAEALHATGSVDQARELIARASSRLDERAARIGDPELKESFLGAVPEHARTRELARAWSA